MGITGLLPLLKSIQRPGHIRDWAGKTVGVDAYVDYVMHRVRMLRHFGVTPYLVFDGDYLPSKSGTEVEREKKRAQSKATGLELLKLGRSSQAYLELQKSIDVTPMMARHIIDACASLGVKCLVAPYEADSQLYYLEKMGIIDAVISEDSDLLVFGVKTLLTKLDQFGEFVEVNREHFTACKEISLAGWTQTEFRHMCILSGCDYLENIPTMGLKTAYSYMRRYRDVEKLLRAVQLEGKKKVPSGYLEAFKRADMTFLHQRVFCPIQEQIVMANDPSPQVTIDDEILCYIGPEIEADIARLVACGQLDPMTKEPIQIVPLPPGPSNSAKPWPPPNQKVQMTTTPKNKSITSFFKPKSEARAIVATPVLQPKNTNRIVSQSAPAKTTSASTPMKRPFDATTTSASKKLKTTATTPTPAAVERSPFFATQSRRPINSTPTPKPRPKKNITPALTPTTLALQQKKNVPPIPTQTEESSPSPSLCLPPSPAAIESAKKVAQGWKEAFAFPKQGGVKDLAAVIEKPRVQSTAVLAMTSLQHLGARALNQNPRTIPPSRSATMPLSIPILAKSESADSNESEEFLSGFDSIR
ncbi:PIN domain-like protein [Tricharina praecox]|uniref:PIN domain-like protein n=1 Tax=Tricharina praecox TaxID=43433 RepID=UPI00221FA1AB|nr:PIN domain-like protein [Tricharina praecox]XP_051343660.1 PIN domain-like protein [Tricharina praecox]KAI5841288.1 PIN domain-like protein [Tricharina praecox]KAI5857914.1 PIN domain-like protein [Tricharina praecox]